MFSPGHILTYHHREAAAAAAKQREREEEAERNRAARKAEPTSRTFERSERPAERPAAASPSVEAARPRIALAGNKPTWREREAAKLAGTSASPAAAAAPTPPPAPTTDERVATSEAALPRRTGYVPPHLRGAASAKPDGEAPPSFERSGSRDGTAGRWQPRRGADGESGDTPPPPSRGAYRPPERRRDDGPVRRDDGESPRPTPAPTGGAYRPGAFRRGG